MNFMSQHLASAEQLSAAEKKLTKQRYRLDKYKF